MDKLHDLKYRAYNQITKTVASLTGTLKDSRFIAEGILTPEEFVAAGDHLTHKCNTWQ